MNIPFPGEFAALGTAICWTFGSQFFEAAGKRVGAMSVNLLRLVLAFLFFCLVSLITSGHFIPMDFPLKSWMWLGLSGIIGFSLGDLFLFHAFVDIGPRLSMLIMTLTAPLSALMGLFFLGEIYVWYQWVGMSLTLLGVSWVILERPSQRAQQDQVSARRPRKFRRVTRGGVLMALLGTFGQAAGYILSKYGMYVDGVYQDAFAATQIRVIGGTLGFIFIISFRGYWPQLLKSLTNRPAMGFILGGAFMGPFLGVSLSLLALHYTTAGVAATITALVPVFLIPSVILIGREHVTIRAVLGAIIAVGGVCLLMI